jgi:uncharacterized protein (UPF0548 family)
MSAMKRVRLGSAAGSYTLAGAQAAFASGRRQRNEFLTSHKQSDTARLRTAKALDRPRWRRPSCSTSAYARRT